MGKFMDMLNQAADAFANQVNTSLGTAPQSGNSYANRGGAANNGFFSALGNQFTDISQQINFSNFLVSLGNSGSLYSMGQAEKIGIFKQGLEQCGASSTPNTVLGEIYPIVVKMTEESLRNSSLPTAHSTCPQSCALDREKCEECLKKRLAILEALYYVDRPEEYKNKISAPAKKIRQQGERKCSLCGAPVSSSMKMCEYCDTPVVSVLEEEPAFLSAAQILPPEQAAYDLIYQYLLEDLERIDSPENKKITVAIQFAATAQARQNGYVTEAWVKQTAEEGYTKNMALIKAKMSMSDIRYMADEYHLSVGAYLRGLFEGDPNLQTAFVYRENKRIEQERQESQQRHEEKMQAMRDDAERNKQRNQEFWERRRASYVAPKYSGGPGPSTTGSCCGNCRFYMVHDNKCAYNEFRHPTGANDYCNNHRST